MLGNFIYSNATKLYFGEDALNEERLKYGKNVQLIYGGSSVKKNGIYDRVVEILRANGKKIFEDGGYKILDRSEVLNILKAAM